MKPDQLLNDLGLTMGLSDLKFNEEGCARLVFDGKFAVNLENEPESGQLIIYMTLGPIPAEGREVLYLSLLEGNLFGTQTSGAALAVDSINHEVVLCQNLMTEDLSAASFVKSIEDFVNTGEQWSKNIKHATVPAEAESEAVPFDFSDHRNAFLRG